MPKGTLAAAGAILTVSLAMPAAAGIDWEKGDPLTQFRVLQENHRNSGERAPDFVAKGRPMDKEEKNQDDKDAERLDAVLMEIGTGKAVDAKEIAWAKEYIAKALGVRPIVQRRAALIKEIKKNGYKDEFGTVLLPPNAPDLEVTYLVNHLMSEYENMLIAADMILDSAKTK